jgi:5-(carboxyamino)imidazole ribonucleotide synthase
VGVLGVELFEMPDGELLVNELAPRPHNTGHYTIEACHTSQFENHVRAVLDLPIGDPSMQVPCAVMINVLGKRAGSIRPDGFSDALNVPGAAVHLYGKREARPKRKMGHVTVTGQNPDEVRSRAEQAANIIRL